MKNETLEEATGITMMPMTMNDASMIEPGMMTKTWKHNSDDDDVGHDGSAGQGWDSHKNEETQRIQEP